MAQALEQTLRSRTRKPRTRGTILLVAVELFRFQVQEVLLQTGPLTPVRQDQRRLLLNVRTLLLRWTRARALRCIAIHFGSLVCVFKHIVSCIYLLMCIYISPSLFLFSFIHYFITDCRFCLDVHLRHLSRYVPSNPSHCRFSSLSLPSFATKSELIPRCKFHDVPFMTLIDRFHFLFYSCAPVCAVLLSSSSMSCVSIILLCLWTYVTGDFL